MKKKRKRKKSKQKRYMQYFIENLKKYGHSGVAQDEANIKINREDGKKLCRRCSGSGNELYFAYRNVQSVMVRVIYETA